MNSSPIVFAPDTRLEVRYSTHKLADTLRPFVLDLSNRLMRGGSLGDSVAATASSMPELAAYCVIDRDAEESFSLRQEYLFADWNVQSLEFIRLRDRERYSIDVADGAERLKVIQSLLYRSSSGQHDRTSLYAGAGGHLVELMDALMDERLLVEQERPLETFAPAGVPGVYRLQHASLLYRSATHGVLVDPHMHSTYGLAVQDDIYRDQLHGKVDAILLSHFHEDHFFCRAS